jgi:probable phosphoglycerate mutase
MTTTLLLVRHGQTAWNREERFRGRADVPLDEVGLAQAEATGQRVAAGWRPQAIYASPLSRAVRTAEAIASRTGLIVQPQPELLDIDYGAWQGLAPEEARARWPAEVEAWYQTPARACIPGGETLLAVRERGLTSVLELVARHAGETLVLVGHTVINRAILLGMLGLDLDRFWRLRQDTCALNIVEWDGADFTVGSLNDTCHLRRTAQGG